MKSMLIQSQGVTQASQQINKLSLYLQLLLMLRTYDALPIELLD